MNKNKYTIIDFTTMESMKDLEGNIKYYETEEDARLDCGIYELDEAWIVKLVHQHKEESTEPNKALKDAAQRYKEKYDAKINRIELISQYGREVVLSRGTVKDVEIQLQDDGETLKKKKEKNETEPKNQTST